MKNNKIIFNNLSRHDARLLKKWWDGYTPYYHFIVKQFDNKFYSLVRQY